MVKCEPSVLVHSHFPLPHGMGAAAFVGHSIHSGYEMGRQCRATEIHIRWYDTPWWRGWCQSTCLKGGLWTNPSPFTLWEFYFSLSMLVRKRQVWVNIGGGEAQLQLPWGPGLSPTNCHPDSEKGFLHSPRGFLQESKQSGSQRLGRPCIIFDKIGRRMKNVWFRWDRQHMRSCAEQLLLSLFGIVCPAFR